MPEGYLVEQPFYIEYERLKKNYFDANPGGIIRNESMKRDDPNDPRAGWIYLKYEEEWAYSEEMTILCWKQIHWLRDGICGGKECSKEIDLGFFYCNECSKEMINQRVNR